jgi:hypothetical protein
MTTAPRTSRCDRIISMIDECLAETDAGRRPLDGERHTPSSTGRAPVAHRSLVSS